MMAVMPATATTPITTPSPAEMGEPGQRKAERQWNEHCDDAHDQRVDVELDDQQHMRGEQQQDRRHDVDREVLRPEHGGRFAPRHLRLQAIQLEPQLADGRDQVLVFLDQRLGNLEVAAAVLADERLILDLLRAERALHVAPFPMPGRSAIARFSTRSSQRRRGLRCP
jgi:hypothetical protein